MFRRGSCFLIAKSKRTRKSFSIVEEFFVFIILKFHWGQDLWLERLCLCQRQRL
mgnify:CR=1 FL=1